MALVRLDEADRQTCGKLIRSRLWVIGCALFISCSMVNFAALTLAPASVLVPLEAVQFIVNVAFGKYVRKVEVPLRMYGGVLAMVAGVVLAVAFGESSNFCFTEEELKQKWTWTHGWGWWIFLALTFGISSTALVTHNRLWARRAAGLPVKNAAVVLPVLYAIPSALFGGAQMIVQSKCLAELTELMARGSTLTIAGWFFWVEAILVCGFGLFWFFRLTQSLGMYEPLFIIPLMQVMPAAGRGGRLDPCAPRLNDCRLSAHRW
jgi:drug/metabolite transporter (DMT)-like permease